MANIKKIMLRRGMGAGFVLAGLIVASPALAAQCGDLATLKLADVTVTKAETVTSLDQVSPALARDKAPAPFCRVQGFTSPTKDSHIQFELWMPEGAAWNGKFQALGNGGFLGTLNTRGTLGGVRRHYATMVTNLGHMNAPGAPEDATWALGHPDKVVDYAYRGEHLSVLASRQIMTAFYGKKADHAYYVGCSAGGIQGLTELLRYTDDFDGYVIGNSTPDHIGQELGALWNTLQASLKYPADALRQDQVAAIHGAVLRQCAGHDGGLASDPFLTDPRLCRFKVEVLACKLGETGGTCLTPRQLAIVRAIYAGPRNPRTGEAHLAGIMPGSELSWDKYFTGKTNPAKPDRPWGGFLMDMAYGDPDYLPGQHYLAFDFDKDVPALRARMVGGEPLDTSWNTSNRDLDAFVKAGGKVIQYHGWDDPNIPPLEAVKFRQSLIDSLVSRRKLTVAKATALVDSYYHLFMVPGLGHCSGGDGPWNIGQSGPVPGAPMDGEHDTLTALEQWVEHGVEPKRLIGGHMEGGGPGQGNPNGGPNGGGAKAAPPDMTRPICAYPNIARYNGTGDRADAASFSCGAPGARAAAGKGTHA